MHEDPNGGRLVAQGDSSAEIDASLRRLGTDYVDSLPDATRLGFTTRRLKRHSRLLHDVVKAEKARHIERFHVRLQFGKALYSCGPPRLDPFRFPLQNHYNLMYREEGARDDGPVPRGGKESAWIPWSPLGSRRHLGASLEGGSRTLPGEVGRVRPFLYDTKLVKRIRK